MHVRVVEAITKLIYQLHGIILPQVHGIWPSQKRTCPVLRDVLQEHAHLTLLSVFVPSSERYFGVVDVDVDKTCLAEELGHVAADLEVPSVDATEGSVYETVHLVEGVRVHGLVVVAEGLGDDLMAFDPATWL